MIKPRQKSKIIKAFGKHYSPAIVAILGRTKIRNRNGVPYSQESVRKIVCGTMSHEAIETKIMAEAEKKLSKK